MRTARFEVFAFGFIDAVRWGSLLFNLRAAGSYRECL